MKPRFTILAALIVPLIIAAPASARAPLDFTEDATSVACEAVTSEAGTVRLTASVSSLSGELDRYCATALDRHPARTITPIGR